MQTLYIFFCNPQLFCTPFIFHYGDDGDSDAGMPEKRSLGYLLVMQYYR
jgi:hypothetical protein